MKKLLLIIFTIIVCPMSLMAEDINILLSTDNENLSGLGERSIVALPIATLDGSELTLFYPLSTESQVIIIDQSTLSTVYTETFAATRSLNIDLEEEGLPDGSYTLRIYAFGKWWTGEFILER